MMRFMDLDLDGKISKAEWQDPCGLGFGQSDFDFFDWVRLRSEL
jgi:hypothetical protein